MEASTDRQRRLGRVLGPSEALGKTWQCTSHPLGSAKPRVRCSMSGWATRKLVRAVPTGVTVFQPPNSNVERWGKRRVKNWMRDSLGAV